MRTPLHLVVMGVSGTGKTTIALALAERLGWTYAEGDEFHSSENVSQMTRGLPLTDEDRMPWLLAITRWIESRNGLGESTVVTCSALKRSYRDVLGSAEGDVRFIHLLGDPEAIQARIKARTGHFMPETLLPSQVSTIEPLQDDERGIIVENVGTPAQVCSNIIDRLGLNV